MTTDQAWITVKATPSAPMTDPHRLSGEALAAWVRNHVSTWPAPIPIGAEEPRTEPALFVFSSDGPDIRYALEAHTDGSSVLRLPVGGLRRNPADGETVLAVGEGAVAWISVAAVRLASAYAEHLGCRGELSIEVNLGEGTAMNSYPHEIWNRGSDGFHPVGTRVRSVRPCGARFSLAECGGASLPLLVRPLLVELLGQFGLIDSRHIDVDGVVRRGNFTGHDDRILAWVTAIGAASRP